MSRLLTVLLSCLLLAACSSSPTARRADAYERIGQELGVAATGKADKDALDQAMLPALPLEVPVVPKSEPRFNLAVNNAQVTQVLTALVRDTQYNMMFPPEVDGVVSLTMKNTTVFEVLDTLRDIYGYDYKIQGKRIHVYPKTIQARIFKINYLSGRRQGSSDTRVTSSSPTSTSSGSNNSSSSNQQNSAGGSQSSGSQSTTRSADSARIHTTTDNDFWRDIEEALKAIIGDQDGRRVVVNAVSGVALVKALPNELRAVEDYLKATKLVVERQVMLEAKIVEVQLNDSYQAGINWAKFGGVANRFAFGVLQPGVALNRVGALTSTNTVPAASLGGAGSLGPLSNTHGAFGLAFQSNDFAALLSFLEGQGDVQVLSSPRIATTNNQKAVLKVGTDDYFVTSITGNSSTNTTTSGTAAPTLPTINLQPFFSGIALDVTPQIDEDGNIILHVHPSVSLVVDKLKPVDLGQTLGTVTLPLASSTINESDSVVRVPDGSIVAIGGLMSQKQNNGREGLPGVSGVPGLGLLFGQKSVANSKRELVILLRSTIIKDEKNWRDLAAEAQERVQAFDPRQTRTIELQ